MAKAISAHATFWFDKSRQALRGPALMMAVASLFGLALATNGLGYRWLAVVVTAVAIIACDAMAEARANRARADEAHFILGLLLRTGHTSITIEKIEPKEDATEGGLK